MARDKRWKAASEHYTIRLSDSELEAVKGVQAEQGFDFMSQAIRHLVREGLKLRAGRKLRQAAQEAALRSSTPSVPQGDPVPRLANNKGK